MVTFRNNNNNRREISEEIQETLKPTTITLNLDPIFQIMIILNENHLEEIIIMHQN